MSTDRYEIRGKIGQGGVGAVYRAYDTQLRREVAMKRVLQDGEMNSEDATANLLKEATALSSVQHPHIVTVYDAGIDAEGPYVVMELINGKTLDEMVERGTLTFEDFKEVAVQSQEAMIAAQDLNLVHRDLKPSNVMVSWLPSGRFQVKIVDFGLAKFSAKPSLQNIDHGDAVFGSIFFMAPEQFERTPLDRRTDMYSLGAMYYYALAGDYPFNGDTAPQVMAAHLQNKVAPLLEVRPDLPPWVCDWVMWHIRRDMNDRPASARAALEQFLAHDSAHTFGVTQTQQLQGPATTGPLTTGGQAVSGHTAPQPILSPSGQVNPHTASQRIGTTTAPLNATGQVNTAPGAAPAQQPQVAAQQPAVQQQAAQPTATQAPEPAAPVVPTKPKIPIIVYAIVAVVLIGVIVAVSMMLGKKLDEGDTTGRVNALIEKLDTNDPTKPVPMTSSDADLLLNIVAGKVEFPDKAAALNLLCAASSSDGSTDMDRHIASFIVQESSLAPTIKITILEKVIKRRAKFNRSRTSAYDSVLNWLVLNPSDKATPAGLSSVSDFANAGGDFDRILTVLESTTNAVVIDRAGSLLGDIVVGHRRKGVSKLVEKLAKSFSDFAADPLTDEKRQMALLTALGYAGNKQAMGAITVGLGSQNVRVRIHAAKSLDNWPSADAIDLLTTKVKSESPSSDSGKKFRTTAIRSLISVATNEKLRDHEAA